MKEIDDGTVRHFDSGATKSSQEGKFDYEAFLSPRVLEAYAAYMHKNRFQADGTMRDGDNWQKGIELDVYMKSLIRHVMTLWSVHRYGEQPDKESLKDSLTAVMFNTMGYLHEVLTKEEKEKEIRAGDTNTGSGGL